MTDPNRPQGEEWLNKWILFPFRFMNCKWFPETHQAVDVVVAVVVVSSTQVAGGVTLITEFGCRIKESDVIEWR